MADREARRYFVRGRVQGVGYRAFARDRAKALGLECYARNLADGRVEVYAAGAPRALSEFAGYLWNGPLLADVRGVDEIETSFERV